MKIENAIFYFHGRVTNEMIQYFIKIMDNELVERKMSKIQRKRVISVMIESLQNVIHYNTKLQKELDISEIEKGAYFVFYQPEPQYLIYYLLVANLIRDDDMHALQRRLSVLKDQNIEQLHEEQLKILEEKSIQAADFQQSGAGVGLIDMARRCNGNFEYNFYDFNHTFKYFTMQFLFKN